MNCSVILALLFSPMAIVNHTGKNAEDQFFQQLRLSRKNHNFLDLTRDYPDFPCTGELSKLAGKLLRTYSGIKAPVAGELPLREQISGRISDAYSLSYSPEKEILITAGANQAMYTAISTLVEEGDEVVVFEPAYPLYIKAIESCGGIPKTLSLKPPLFQVDWEAVQKIINASTRMIVVNTPHNPTGTLWSAFDMEKLRKIIQGTKIIVLSDEVYEHIILEGYEHQSVARFPELAQRSIIISSFTNLLNIPGWNIGFCAAPEELMEKIIGHHLFQISSVNTPLQLAIAGYLETHSGPADLTGFYQSRRDIVSGMLKNSVYQINPSPGTFYQLLGFSESSDETDWIFSLRLMREAGVGVTPLSVFYRDGTLLKYVRLSYATAIPKLKTAVEKIRGFIP